MSSRGQRRADIEMWKGHGTVKKTKQKRTRHCEKKTKTKKGHVAVKKTSQELRMLSTVTLNCQVTKVVKNSGSQLLELQTVSQMSQVCRIVLRRNCDRTLPHTMSHW